MWSLRSDTSSTAHDPYAGMKTPGQRQLICLQKRVKVGELTVEEAVQEFKAWQFNQDKRSQSVRFQQVPAGIILYCYSTEFTHTSTVADSCTVCCLAL